MLFVIFTEVMDNSSFVKTLDIYNANCEAPRCSRKFCLTRRRGCAPGSRVSACSCLVALSRTSKKNQSQDSNAWLQEDRWTDLFQMTIYCAQGLSGRWKVYFLMRESCWNSELQTELQKHRVWIAASFPLILWSR